MPDGIRAKQTSREGRGDRVTNLSNHYHTIPRHALSLPRRGESNPRSCLSRHFLSTLRIAPVSLARWPRRQPAGCSDIQALQLYREEHPPPSSWLLSSRSLLRLDNFPTEPGMGPAHPRSRARGYAAGFAHESKREQRTPQNQLSNLYFYVRRSLLRGWCARPRGGGGIFVSFDAHDRAFTQDRHCKMSPRK